MRFSGGSALFGLGSMAVIAAVVAGLFVLGSPADERARRMDRRRVEDLQGVMAATDLYWTRHGSLPTSLDNLMAEPGVSVSTRDPNNGEIYGFQPVDSIQYEVCASFETESEKISGDPDRDLWVHGSGPQCFQLEAKDITDQGSGQE